MKEKPLGTERMRTATALKDIIIKIKNCELRTPTFVHSCPCVILQHLQTLFSNHSHSLTFTRSKLTRKSTRIKIKKEKATLNLNPSFTIHHPSSVIRHLYQYKGPHPPYCISSTYTRTSTDADIHSARRIRWIQWVRWVLRTINTNE